MSEFQPGATVRVTDPEGFLSHVKTKVRDRDGVVKRVRDGDGYIIVTFPARGRRREYQHAFHPRDLTVQP
ncbi:MAG TPA: hypothetical protein VGD46_13455 [Rhizobacter sp.]